MANSLIFGSKVVFINGNPITLATAASDPGSAVAGDMYYNTTSNTPHFYNGSAWLSIGSGSGTVTTVSVVTANGLAGTVANASTTPAITLSTTITGILQGNGTAISAATTGNLTDAGTDGITITNGTGAVLGSGTSIAQHVADTTHNGYLSSTDWNTFNTSAGSAITALTGDATASGPGSAALTLATVNSNVGTFGSSTSIPTFTVNAKGLITAASGNAVVAPAGTLSGTTLNSTVTASSLTSLGTQAQALNMGSNKITNLTDGTASSDAATYGQLLAVSAGLSFKNAVRLATTAPLSPTYNFAAGGGGADTLTSGTTGTLTVDGVLTALGDRILVKDETSGNQPYNGIYTVTTAGAVGVAYVLTRATDMRTWASIPGSVVVAQAGTVNADSGFVSTSAPGGTLDTTFISWSEFGYFLADGSTLQLVGNTFSVKNNGITYSKIQQASASTIIGNPTGSTANVSEITLGATLTFSGSALQTVAMTGDVTSSANSFATTVAKIQGTTVSGTTGSGNVVFSTSPSLTTPNIGAASGTSLSLSGLTASQAVFTDGSKNLVSNPITGTGNVVMSASPTLTGTITAAAANFSGAIGANGGITSSSSLLINANSGASAINLESSSFGRSTDGTNFVTEIYTDSTTLLDNQSSPTASSFTFDAANFAGEEITYSIKVVNSTRIGTLRVTARSTGVNPSLTDMYTESDDCGVVWSATNSGSVITLNYTTTNQSGNNRTMRADIKQFRR